MYRRFRQRRINRCCFVEYALKIPGTRSSSSYSKKTLAGRFGLQRNPLHIGHNLADQCRIFPFRQSSSVGQSGVGLFGCKECDDSALACQIIRVVAERFANRLNQVTHRKFRLSRTRTHFCTARNLLGGASSSTLPASESNSPRRSNCSRATITPMSWSPSRPLTKTASPSWI